MAGKKVKVSRIEEETRRETVTRGIKHGSLQNTIDKVLDKYGDPFSEKATDVMKKLHPGADVAAPAVDALIKSGLLAITAELAANAKHIGTRIPGFKAIDAEKYEGLAAYVRSYAGQRTGTKTADSLFKLAPMLANIISNPQLSELLNDEALNTKAVPRLTEGNKEGNIDLEGAVKKLSEDDV